MNPSHLLLSIFLIICTISIASATHSYSNGVYTVSNENVNLEKLASDINNPSIVRNEGSTWYVNCGIRASNSNIYFNNSKIILGSSIEGGSLYCDDTQISCYNFNTKKYLTRTDNGPVLEPDYFFAKNTRLEGFSHLKTNYKTGQIIDGLAIYNFSDELGAVFVPPCKSVTFKNFVLNTVSGCGIWIEGTTDFALENADIQHCGRYDIGGVGSGGETSYDGIAIAGYSKTPNKNTVLRNVFVNDSSYGALNIEGDGSVYGIHGYNVTTGWAAHNSCDLHGGSGHYFDGLVCFNGMEQAALLITGYDSTFKNLKLSNVRGNCLELDSPTSGGSDYCYNNTFENVELSGSVRGAQLLASHGNKFINVTSTNAPDEPGIYLGTYDDSGTWFSPKNTIIVDYSGSNVAWLEGGSNNVFINPKWSRLDYQGGDYWTYYYPDIVVKDSDGNPVKGATVTFSTDSKNGYGDSKKSFVTDSSGKLGGSRANWAAIPYQHNSKSGSQTYKTTITAFLSGQSKSIDVTPSGAWYSASHEALAGPLQTITLGMQGETNTTIEPPVIPPTNNTTNLPANNTTGNVTIQKPVKAPIAAFTFSQGSGYKIKFWDKSQNPPTSWKWSFGDGTTSTSRSPWHTYKRAGYYTVKLTVKNKAGIDSETKRVTVRRYGR
jgi:hypothetical protein